MALETYVSDSSRDLTGRLFAWPFTVSVEAGLGRGDLVNGSPATTVLMKEGLIGFGAKTKTGGKSGGRPWRASHFSFSNEKWLSGGYQLLLEESGDSIRDFWIGRPLIPESEIGFFNQAPAFRS